MNINKDYLDTLLAAAELAGVFEHANGDVSEGKFIGLLTTFRDDYLPTLLEHPKDPKATRILDCYKKAISEYWNPHFESGLPKE